MANRRRNRPPSGAFVTDPTTTPTSPAERQGFFFVFFCSFGKEKKGREKKKKRKKRQFQKFEKKNRNPPVCLAPYTSLPAQKRPPVVYSTPTPHRCVFCMIKQLFILQPQLQRKRRQFQTSRGQKKIRVGGGWGMPSLRHTRIFQVFKNIK